MWLYKRGVYILCGRPERENKSHSGRLQDLRHLTRHTSPDAKNPAEESEEEKDGGGYFWALNGSMLFVPPLGKNGEAAKTHLRIDFLPILWGFFSHLC